MLIFYAVLPKIAPFTAGDEAHQQGDYLTITCTFTHGDLPINITWSHDGQVLPTLGDPDSGITLITTKRSSVLSIDSIAGEHAGNYTCTGTNRAGSDSLATSLFVNG